MRGVVENMGYACTERLSVPMECLIKDFAGETVIDRADIVRVATENE